MWIFATSNLWSESPAAPGTLRTSLYSFWTDTSQIRSPAGVDIDLLMAEGVKSSLGFLQPCAGDVKSIPFTNVDAGLASVLSLFQSMCSNSFSIWFISNQTVPLPHYGGVCLIVSISFKNFFSYSVHFLLSVIFNPQCWHVKLHQQTFTGSAFIWWEMITVFLTFWHRSFTFNSNKSPTWYNNFSVYYRDVCLQFNMFRAFSRPSSGAQWLQWKPLVLPSYRGDSRGVFLVGPAVSGWWFIWIVRWCTDLQTLNFTFKS